MCIADRRHQTTELAFSTPQPEKEAHEYVPPILPRTCIASPLRQCSAMASPPEIGTNPKPHDRAAANTAHSPRADQQMVTSINLSEHACRDDAASAPLVIGRTPAAATPIRLRPCEPYTLLLLVVAIASVYDDYPDRHPACSLARK